MNLSASEFQSMIRKHGKVTMELIQKEKGATVKKITVPKVNKYLNEIKLMLKLSGIKFQEEHKFSQERKFRFDLVIVGHKIAIEYEGIFSNKSRHTNMNGYSKDVEKYNLAASLGWTVLRYTAKNYKNVLNDLHKIINLKK